MPTRDEAKRLLDHLEGLAFEALGPEHPNTNRVRDNSARSLSDMGHADEALAHSQAACASNGDVLPPLGLAATLPNRTNRCIHRTAELTLTANRSAASCRDAPASTHSTNRVRRSKE